MVKFENVDNANKCINKIVEMMKNYDYIDTADYEDMFARILFILDEIVQLIKFKECLK